MKMKTILLVAGLLVAGLTVNAQTQTWDPDGNSINDGGAGTWNTTSNFWLGGTTWGNGNNAIFGDSGANYTVDIADGGVTVGDLTYQGVDTLWLKSVTDNLGMVSIKSGGATWNTGGGSIRFLNNTVNDTPLSINSGDTLTVVGGGQFDTGEKPNGANWVATGATLDIGTNTLVRGNNASVGQFATVKLGAGSTYVHERNANQGYANNWVLGGGKIKFSNRWANNGHITVNGTISGNADELTIDMASTSRAFYLTKAAAYTAGTNRVAEGWAVLNVDNGLSSSVLAIGGVGGKNARFNLNGHNQTITGLFHDTGNTREIRNNAGGTVSTLTIDVANGNSYSYGGNFAGGGTINLVKDGAGSQTISRAAGVGHTTSISNLTVNAGELVWNVQGNGNVGAVNVGAAGKLTGTGFLNGVATIDGQLNPGNSPGTMTFNNSLTLNSTATLTLEFTSTAAGQFDVLANDGGDTLTAGGVLDLVNLGYTATLGDSFTVLTNWGGFAGSFSSITGTDLGGGLSFDTSNLLVDGTVSVIPEPATLGMVAFLGAGMLFVRRIFMM